MTDAIERVVLTPEATEFVLQLHKEFNSRREALLLKRKEKQSLINSGAKPDFLSETAALRKAEWQVAPAPSDLNDRRVEITGPVEAKMMINALNSGAKVFMADFEDSLAPTWKNILEGQKNLQDAVRKTLQFSSPEGKQYTLKPQTATLVVRPRGWHLEEKHFLFEKRPVSASIFDFGLYFFHNAHELVRRGSGPYFYLPKMESYLEARLWNDIFISAQEKLGIPRGTIRATVLIETILAAFEMEEILYELKEHAAGLNAGRWDYIFSAIKKFRDTPTAVLPDRSQVTMQVPFMKSYAQLLVQVCHKRGAHAMGGMSAFIPNRKDPKVTETALAKVREDKERETRAGFDGTWVAHPDLVPVAMEVFDRALGTNPNQKQNLASGVTVTASDLLNMQATSGEITEDGVRANLSVALQYVEKWLGGTGAAAIFNLMEDAATAEISRAQLWQWIRHQCKLSDGRVVTPQLYRELCEQELQKLGGVEQGNYREALEILDGLVLSQNFTDFLTIPAYRYFT